MSRVWFALLYLILNVTETCFFSERQKKIREFKQLSAVSSFIITPMHTRNLNIKNWTQSIISTKDVAYNHSERIQVFFVISVHDEAYTFGAFNAKQPVSGI